MYTRRYVYLHTMCILGVSHNDNLYAVLCLLKVRSQVLCSNPHHGATLVTINHFVVSSSIYTYFTCIHLFHSVAYLSVYACVCLRRTLEVVYLIFLCVLLVNTGHQDNEENKPVIRTTTIFAVQYLLIL